jgi:hypothetical protein
MYEEKNNMFPIAKVSEMAVLQHEGHKQNSLPVACF